MTNKGQYTSTPGSTLDTGDFVEFRGEWYRLGEQTDQAQNKRTGNVTTRVFRGETKNGGRRALLLDSTNVKAYRLHR